jgi:hypothetical protein
MASILNATTSSGLVTSADNSGSLQLATNNGTTAVTIDTSQNVGIGLTPPVGSGNYRSLNVGATFIYGNTGLAVAAYNNNADINDKYIITGVASSYTQSSGNHIWYNAASGSAGASISFTERMRIDSSGNVLVGTTNSSIGNNFTTVGTGNSALNLNSSGTSNTYTTLGFFNQNNYQAQIFWQQSNDNFYVQNNNNGVYLSVNATSWTANSDERLKENLVPIENGLEKVCFLRSVIGNFKSDENKKPTPFLIAQDVQAVLPEAVSTSTIKGDETQTEYLGVAYTEIIPLLVASIKELKAELDATKAEVQALKGVA